MPIGLRAIHPTWIEHGLADLPDRARAAVAGVQASPVDVWLARSATAHLPAMIVEPAIATLVATHAAFVLVDGIPTAPATSVVAWLDSVGADQLAFATSDAAVRPLARLGDAPARIQRAPRKGQLGSQRSAIARCTDVAMDELAHVRIGARALAARLTELPPRTAAAAALQIAVRLPRPVGLVIHRELVAPGPHVADAPTWAALLA